MAKAYKSRAIETIAQNTLMQYNPRLVNGEPQAIPIEDVIEFHQGIILQFRNLSKNGTILGMTIFEDMIIPIYNEKTKKYEPIIVKEGTIIIDKRLLTESKEKRLRFTLAHEYSHYIIHNEYYKETSEVANKLSTDSDARTEREADELAAAMLMPFGRLKVAYKRLSGKLNRTGLINHLAIMFNVSNQAMEIRLQNLKLI